MFAELIRFEPVPVKHEIFLLCAGQFSTRLLLNFMSIFRSSAHLWLVCNGWSEGVQLFLTDSVTGAYHSGVKYITLMKRFIWIIRAWMFRCVCDMGLVRHWCTFGRCWIGIVRSRRGRRCLVWCLELFIIGFHNTIDGVEMFVISGCIIQCTIFHVDIS